MHLKNMRGRINKLSNSETRLKRPSSFSTSVSDPDPDPDPYQETIDMDPGSVKN